MLGGHGSVKLRLLWISLIVIILGWGRSFAQENANTAGSAAASDQVKGAITGTVSDQTGAGIPGAIIKISNNQGVSQSATSDNQGLYAVTDLAAGPYNISVTARGAKIFEANIVLSPGQVLTLSVSGAPVAQTTSPVNPQPEQGQSPQVGAAPAANPETAPPVPSPSAPSASASPQVAPVQATGPGSITGTINDQTGAVVVGATVNVANTKGVSQSAVSDAKGNYSIKDLPAGSYSVTVTAKGFKPFKADSVTLAAGQELPLDAGLEAAGEATQVNVEGNAVAQVETENANVSGTITQKEVVKLQLNGRNFTQLIALTPGVSNQTGQDEAKVGITGSVKYSVNGGRVEYNTFDVDGSDVLNAGLNGAESTLIVYPSLDAIQEVKVLTSNFGAMYGRTASGQVLVNLKSGGSQFHGNAYEFLRNEFFNARNYFDQTAEAPLYRRNDFGFTFGGPLFIPGHYNTKKDKTYFFVSEEFRYEKSPVQFNTAVPTLAERSGNFSDVCPPVPAGSTSGVPVSQSQYPDCPQVSLGETFPGNNLVQPAVNGRASGTTIDANAQALLNTNLIPLPNAQSGCNSSLVGQIDPQTGAPIMPCYVATISPATYWREDLVRFDQVLTPKMTATFHYIHDSWDTTVLNPQWGFVKNSFPTVENRFLGPGTSIVARLTTTFTPSLLNVFIAGYTNSHITLTNQNGPGGANVQRPAGLSFKPGTLDPVSLIPQYPIGYLFNNGFGGKAPGIVIGGNNGEYGGQGFAVDPSYMPWEHTNPNIQWRDEMSKQWRKHTLQFGVQYVYAQKNETNGAIGAATGDLQGILQFSNVSQGRQGSGTGNAFANFLVNFNGAAAPNPIESFTQDSAQLRYYNRYTIAEPYFQDDWKATRRLTFNLGLRLSLFGNYHEKYLRAYNFDPAMYSLALAAEIHVDPTTGLVFSNKPNQPIPINLSNVDPRLLNGIVQCGVNAVPPSCMKNHLFNYGPRFGFAWDPRGDGMTSIRGGYGIFYEHGTGNEANTGSLEASSPLVLSMTQHFPSSYTCIGGTGGSAACPLSPTGAYPLNVTGVPTMTKWPYTQQWSFSIQRQLRGDMVATLAYVGSKGTHLTVQRQINQLRPVSAPFNPYALHQPIITTSGTGDCGSWTGDPSTGGGGTFTLTNGTIVTIKNPAYINLVAACEGIKSATSGAVSDVNTLRPFPGYGQIYSLDNAANSIYHAFQATLRRTKGPVTAGVSYTYSHSIDEASDRSDTTFVNTYDLRSNRASSDFDQRHLLNISYILQLPKLGQKFSDWTASNTANGTQQPGSSSRFAHLVADGWEFSGITIFQSGTPFSVVNGGGNTGIGLFDNAGVANGIGPGSYPDVMSSLPKPLTGTNSQSFGPLLGNPSIFVAPRGLTFGNAGRNFMNNPSRLNFDMALLKLFKIRESDQLEFRVEAFNIFNHTQFRIFDPNNPGNSGNNVISCYAGPNYSAGFQGGGSDCLTGNSFLHPVDAHRPRTIQLGLKYSF